MHITRHNYEEFFILYMDNELDSEGRLMVERFVKENPDLQADLEMLLQSRFSPDNSIVFTGKEALMKSSAACDINADNYEQWLILYVDNELNPEQDIAVENFAMANPYAAQELDLLRKTKLRPEEHVIFFDKDSLYRKENKTRPLIVVRQWRVAAAAVLLVGTGAVAYFLNDSRSTTSFPTARVISGPQRSVDPKIVNPQIFPPDSVVSVNETIPNGKNSTTVKLSQRKIAAPVKLSVEKEAAPQSTDEAIALTVDDGNQNNLPSRRFESGSQDGGNTLIAALPSRKALTDLKANNSLIAVTNKDRGSLIPMSDGATDGAQPEFATKTSFRGILRKITRTLEKTTNIKATDEQDRLLVGGLAIRL
jgi:anti-sigma factor RsiW